MPDLPKVVFTRQGLSLIAREQSGGVSPVEIDLCRQL